MKGIVTALAALAALTGSALADGVASRNVVGYVQNALGDTANSQIVCFEGIGSVKEIDIQSIIPVVPDDADPLEAWQASIMVLTPGMETFATYIYFPAADAADGLGAGWFLDDGETRLTGENAVTFDPGIGFTAINDYGEGLQFTYSGQVATEATVVELGETANACGNNTLFPINIQDITVGIAQDQNGDLVVEDNNGNKLEGWQISIMTLTSGMETDATYIYFPAEEAADGLGAGWFLDDGETRLTDENAVTFAPGEGFFVINDYGEGAMVKIPANPQQ